MKSEIEIGLPTIQAALEFRRDQYGLKQYEFCALLQMSPTHYSEFLKGKRGLPLNAVKKAYAIGVPAECLLQDDKPSRIAVAAVKEVERRQLRKK